MISDWRIEQMDALEFLRSLPDASVDALVTDPPYCSGSVAESARAGAVKQGVRDASRFGGWFVGDNMGTAGLVWLLRSVAFEACRFLKPSGSAVVFCDWRQVPNLAPAIESSGLRYQNMVVWDKGAMGLGVGFRAQHEIALHFTNGAPAYHSRSESNVIRCKRVSATEREHQTQKPVELMERIVRVVSPHGGLVVDPFAGAGTTGVAAVLSGRRFAGSERDARHVSTSMARLATAGATTIAAE